MTTDTVVRSTAEAIRALRVLYVAVCAASPAGAALAALDPRDVFITYNGRQCTFGFGRIGPDGRAEQVLEAIEADPDDWSRFGLLLWATAVARGGRSVN